MKVRKLTVSDLIIVVTAEEEDIPVRGNAISSGDADYDKKIEDEILEELESNEWAWCCVEVTCRYKGMEATEYLGSCSYKDKEDFIKNSGYYDDMVNTCLEDIQSQLDELIEDVME